MFKKLNGFEILCIFSLIYFIVINTVTGSFKDIYNKITHKEEISEAYDQGYNAALLDLQEEYYSEAYAEGYYIGYEEGVSNEKMEGQYEAYEEGYSEGYEAALNYYEIEE